MRLSGKFIFACASVFTFLATITAVADHAITSIKKDATNDVVVIGDYTMTLKPNERVKLFDAITNQTSTTTVTATTITVAGAATAIVDNDTYTMTFDDGSKVVFTPVTVAAAPTEKTITMAYTKSTATTSPASHPIALANIDFASPGFIKVAATNTVDTFMTQITVSDAERNAISSALTAKDFCSFAGAHPIRKKNGAAEDDVAAVYHQCYSTDNNMLLCVNWTTAVAAVVSVRSSPPLSKVKQFITTVTGPAIVLGLSVVLVYLSAFAFSIIDAEGYQAGKEASSLMEGIKSLLPDAEGYGGERFYDDDDETSEVYKVDPSTGRTIRVRKAGSAVGGDDTESFSEEKTDASAFTVLAALLAVPFLL
jgi:hypothetical protein